MRRSILGTATYGGARGDVGGAFGSRFTNSGYDDGQQPHAWRELPHRRLRREHGDERRSSTTAAVNVTISSSSRGRREPTPTDPNSTPLPDPKTPPPGPGPGPRPDAEPQHARGGQPAALTFGATNNGALRTGAQTVTVGFTNGGRTWSVASDAGWLNLSPASGSGAGSFSVTVNDDTYPAGADPDGDLDDYGARRGELAAARCR